MNEKFRLSWSSNAAAPFVANYTCPHCNAKAHPLMTFSAGVTETLVNRSMQNHGLAAAIVICPSCTRPTYFNNPESVQIPANRLGSNLVKLPPDVLAAYNQARDCSSVGAHTATVMIARKILMHLAVEEGAAVDLKFFQYVDYLSANGHVPPKGKDWVTKIKDKGNEANHELPAMTASDASEIMHLVEMLLRFNYEMV